MKHYYYYDSNKCEFVSVTYSTKDKFIHTLTTWLTVGIVVAGVLITTMAYFSGSPAEVALKAENKELLKQFRAHQEDIRALSAKIDGLAERDNEIYRTVLGIDPIPADERLAGVGGSPAYTSFDGLSETTLQLLQQTSLELEIIERQIDIQQLSLEEVKEFYNENVQKMNHLPVMRPVETPILSHFGMRNHPVLRVRRMHDGVDFRARVGTPIYAPGDGTISYAANRAGGYGLVIEIEHGYGYLTRYAHLSGFADGVRSGRKIKRGDIIGYTGRTGRVSGPHLHYEIHKDGRPVDPMNYLFADLTPQEYRRFVNMGQKAASGR